MGSIDVSDYSWTEVRPGRWERDIDEAEQFYTSLAKKYAASGRCCSAVTGSVVLSTQATEQEVEDALRKGWLRLRYESPTVASRVEYNEQWKKCRKIYEMCLSSESQAAWIEDTFRVIRTKLSGLQWCNSDPPVPALPTVFVIKRLNRRSEAFTADLILRARPDIVDDQGVLMLLNTLVEYAAQALHQGDAYPLPAFGDEWTRLSPPFRVAAGVPSTLKKQQIMRLEKAASSNAKIRKDVEIAGFSTRSRATQPGRHQRVAITLSVESTHRLLKACKALGLSASHAYHTAIGTVLRDLQKRHSRSRTIRYIDYSLLDERSQCAEPYNSPTHAASVYHSVCGECLAIDLAVPPQSIGAPNQLRDYSIPRRQEFMKIASAVRRFDLNNRNDKHRVQMVPSYWGMITPSYPEDNATPQMPKPYSNPSVSLSDLGVLDDTVSPIHGAFTLDNPWVTREHLVTGLALFLGVWDGRLTLSATYNDAWHTRSEALAFLDRCNVVTIQALGA
ncbi:hypothetical protein BDV18DRAFT_167657 [Aspergillus unguis]